MDNVLHGMIERILTVDNVPSIVLNRRANMNNRPDNWRIECLIDTNNRPPPYESFPLFLTMGKGTLRF